PHAGDPAPGGLLVDHVDQAVAPLDLRHDVTSSRRCVTTPLGGHATPHSRRWSSMSMPVPRLGVVIAYALFSCSRRRVPFMPTAAIVRSRFAGSPMADVAGFRDGRRRGFRD